MNGLHQACITRRSITNNDPRLVVSAGWMPDMGFIPGALVQYLPEPDGITFVLCDENISKYSALLHATKEKGGLLLSVYHYRDGPQLCLSAGQQLTRAGFAYGDKLLARYEYGLIRIRKLPHNTVLLSGSHIIGPWLPDCGFTPDAVLGWLPNPG